MPRSRQQAWLRDEVLLALNLFLNEAQIDTAGNRSISQEQIGELSTLLRRLPVEQHLADGAEFRSAGAVSYKLGNFAAIDVPGTGFPHFSAADEELFEEWVQKQGELVEVASAIRQAILAESAPPAESLAAADTDDFTEAPEGTLLTGQHVRRERNARLVRTKKAHALQEHGRLACTACDFDFAAAYGDRGEGFIECHHLRPLAELLPGTRTRLEDLALVCANCHRMIHRRSPWLSMDELRETVAR